MALFMETSFILKLRFRNVYLEAYTSEPWACILTPNSLEAHHFATRTSAYAVGICLGFSFVDLLVEPSTQFEFDLSSVS